MELSFNHQSSIMDIFSCQIGISVEHPLRPPYFSLSLVVDPLSESSSEWFNELRVMEAEVPSLSAIPVDCSCQHAVNFHVNSQVTVIFPMNIGKGE